MAEFCKRENLDYPIYLFHQGNNSKAYEFMGSHRVDEDTVVFRTWAPHASSVSVVGEFNNWDSYENPMYKISDSIWEIEISGKIEEFTLYKYAVKAADGRTFFKSDPYGYHMETRPGTATKFYNLDNYTWNDDLWLKKRASSSIYNLPVNIYEVHAGSWRRFKDGENFSYRKLADELVPYVKEMGYTHIEFMPLSEYPFDGSWGYQVCGYYAATSRYGTPADFMYLIDTCHKNEIGVIIDWVPAHFPKDECGLFEFDGEPCYEYADPKKGEHKSWGTKVFDFGRNEVQSFLVSNAMFWLDKYHVDGIRVDAVASMLYLNYDREDGEWMPNINGGVENLEAVAFIKKLSENLFRDHEDIMLIAEESTAWPNVTRPTCTDDKALGFNFKWNMGWMNDVIRYFNLDGLSRKYNHDCLTFSFFYAFSENFVLPISHDEVVHGKGSLINKHPGNPENPNEYKEKFAGLRSMLAYMYAHPGKKLLFMGSEFGQFKEWDFASELDWGLLEYDMHKRTQEFTKSLNNFYKNNSELWEIDYSWEGFEWIIPDDNCNSVLAFKRKNDNGEELIVIFNFTKVNREGYLCGVNPGTYEVVFSTDDPSFGGTGYATTGKVTAQSKPMHNKQNSIEVNLAGNSALFLKKIKE
ncbi:MAG: 1,4-alpha-glucan branching protein GlgB [Oscillospiraceae bacterium]|nr:1,4-alpha-glucan branching protein GlgB [Candidatus Limimonas coprohippi]